MKRKRRKMGKRRTYTGEVVSDKMQKTIIVKVARLAKHAKYNRIIKLHNKFKAHDESNSAKAGDLVRIEETRPLSKDKRYRLLEIVKKVKLVHVKLKEDIAQDASKKENNRSSLIEFPEEEGKE
jgi:small subunit ribosomal protein S17